MNTGKIFTIIKWVRSGWSWGGDSYGYKDIVCSFTTRKGALSYLKNTIGAKYVRGYYLSGQYLYTVKQTNIIN